MSFTEESILMTLCRRFGFERTAWALRRLHCPVQANALVLEVGSGGNPYPRANVLLDAYQESRERHWVPLKADRPTVLGFAENLPFKDGSFDFVIASHVLEHSADPARFLKELQRVARAGYIETPDALMERINPYRDHRLEVTVREGRLVIRKKRAWVVDPELVELYEHAAKITFTRQLIPRRPFAFHVRYYWEDKISYTLKNEDTDAGWPPPPDKNCTKPGPSGGVRRWILDGIRACLSQRSRNQSIDFVALLRCPRCRAECIERKNGELFCSECETRYKMRNGIPEMGILSLEAD